MKENQKTYKIIIQYTETGHTSKKFKIEYSFDAFNRSEAIEMAEKAFNTYSQSNSASWVRILDPSGIRVWRVFPGDPNTPQFIDKLIEKLPGENDNETLDLIKQLGSLEDSAASSKIIALTKSENIDIVVNAINALGNIGDPTALIAVKNTYFQRNNPQIRLAIVNNLLKLALPEDNLTSFYLTAIKDPNTREAVFNLENACLFQVWLPEISNEKEFEKVKKHALRLGNKALAALNALNLNHPQVISYATQLVQLLKPKGTETYSEEWKKAVEKYKLL